MQLTFPLSPSNSPTLSTNLLTSPSNTAHLASHAPFSRSTRSLSARTFSNRPDIAPWSVANEDESTQCERSEMEEGAVEGGLEGEVKVDGLLQAAEAEARSGEKGGKP